MNCLVIGGTSFLGKKILQLLVDDPRVQQIHVVSRSHKTHPSPKVKLHIANLIQPWNFNCQFDDLDVIIHLIGLDYQNLEFSQNYQKNVLIPINLINKIKQMKRNKKPQILFASHLSVIQNCKNGSTEAPLIHLPIAKNIYSHTKALGERALSDSRLPVRVFRLGALIGDSQQGFYEKYDPENWLRFYFSSFKTVQYLPYGVMNFLYNLSALKLERIVEKSFFRLLTPEFTPLLPVDAAAKIFHRAVFMDAANDHREFYHVFSPDSIISEVLYDKIFKRLLPKIHPKFKKISDLNLINSVLENSHFESTFNKNSIPHFNDYEENFFKGFFTCHAKKYPSRDSINPIATIQSVYYDNS